MEEHNTFETTSDTSYNARVRYDRRRNETRRLPTNRMRVTLGCTAAAVTGSLETR